VARVNVEESAFVMARRLAFSMRWDEDAALGKLARFWHDSQAEEVAECDKTDIAIYFRCSIDETESLIEALLDAKTIKEQPNGRYLIRGNDKHIANLKERRESARIGGLKSGRMRQKNLNQKGSEAYEALVEASASTKTKQVLQASASTKTKQVLQASASTGASNKCEVVLEPRTEQNRAEQSRTEQNNNKSTNVDFAEVFRRKTFAEPIPELSGSGQLQEILKLVSETVQRNWIEIYQDADFIKRELLKAANWLECNGRKAPKDWKARTSLKGPSRGVAAFLSSWLGRAWNDYRKTLSGQNRSSVTDLDELGKKMGVV
jgi:hypothetical protein